MMLLRFLELAGIVVIIVLLVKLASDLRNRPPGPPSKGGDGAN